MNIYCRLVEAFEMLEKTLARKTSRKILSCRPEIIRSSWRMNRAAKVKKRSNLAISSEFERLRCMENISFISQPICLQARMHSAFREEYYAYLFDSLSL